MNYIRHKSEESVEDYLETIFILSRRLPAVRSIDVANELNFSKPSVSVAMKKCILSFLKTCESGNE